MKMYHASVKKLKTVKPVNMLKDVGSEATYSKDCTFYFKELKLAMELASRFSVYGKAYIHICDIPKNKIMLDTDPILYVKEHYPDSYKEFKLAYMSGKQQSWKVKGSVKVNKVLAY